MLRGITTIPSAGALLHYKHLPVAQVVEPLELLHRPLVPPHQEHPDRQTVGDYHQVHVLVPFTRRLEPSFVDVRFQGLPESCVSTVI